jgi:propanol-preferring alcohol dehydrogenase
LKAWILTHQDPVEEKPLTLTELPDPCPRSHEIRIRISYSGICRTDIHIVEGDLPMKKSPIILGHEVVGVVDEMGQGVTRFHMGERVGAYWLHSSCGKCTYCRSGQENYCPDFQATGWHADGGFAEFTLVSEAYAVSLENIQLEPSRFPPLLCPGIAGYAAFKLTEIQTGQTLGLFGYGPTAYYALKVAQSLNIQAFVSTRSPENIARAREEGADWAADASKDPLPTDLDAAILFPPAGNLVEPILTRVKPGGNLVMAPVSSSPIKIEHYCENLWGRTIKTLYQLKRSDAEEFIEIANDLDLQLGVHLFPFEELDEALILAKNGELDQPNAVIEVNPE